jgi:uncharacterized protein DUF6789
MNSSEGSGFFGLRRGIERGAVISGEQVASAVIAGFVATGAMSLVLVTGYSLATTVGSPDAGASLLGRWMWRLAYNPITEPTQSSLPIAAGIHFLSGIAWAFVYAAFAEPRLKGPPWRKGVTFSLIPWVLSLIVFMPLVGGGFFGLALGAGPLPVLGNLVLHVVYGAVLGQVYGPSSARTL